MSSEAVKKQILNAIGALSIPLAKLPSEERVFEACSAAKLLRNRVLREYARVEESVEALRQRQLYEDSDSDDENENYSRSGFTVFSPDVQKLARQDFLFISEMMVMENVVIPLLLAHGMNFGLTLLPQLLKLITAMLMPVPLHSPEGPRQMDYVRRLMERCGTDEFFTLLIQSVAPVAERRAKGAMLKEDVILLEIVLKIITLFFAGPKEMVSFVIGAFTRNHGIELFLVILNQNFFRNESKKALDNNALLEERELLNSEVKERRTGVVLIEEEEVTGGGLDIKNKLDVEKYEIPSEEGDEETEDDESESSKSFLVEEITDDEYNACIQELLESSEQLWRWNMHIVAAMAAIFRCANPVELAQLGFVSKFQHQPQYQIMTLFENGKHFRECKKESDRWRQVARSRNGALSSNGLLVRGTPSSRFQGENGTIGCASTLLGFRSKDPLEKVRDIDLRKKGRFVKGMSDDATSMWSLPLPTKMQLAEHCLSFICYGFEPLNMMVWSRLSKIITSFDSIVRERNELISGFKSSGEDVEVPTVMDKSVLESTQNVLNYINICSSLLRYTREVVRLNKEKNDGVSSDAFHKQWQCISNVISLDHIHYGFELLSIFLSSPDLKKRFDVADVAIYLAELCMTLNDLIDGAIVNDTAVIVAAHALASSVLYNEKNVTLIFETISKLLANALSPGKAGACVLLVYSVLRLMERCSFGGSVLFPKRKRKNSETVNSEAEDAGGANFLNMSRDLVNSSENEDDCIEDTQAKGRDKENEMCRPLSNSLSLKDMQPEQSSLPGGSWRETSVENESLTSSGRANMSTLSSEREVGMGGFYKRLATVKNIKIILFSLRHWRANDADVNAGLAYLIHSLVVEGSETIFFSAPFFLVMRDILKNGEQSHNALYNVCNQIVYDFFNPSFARILDEKRETHYGSSINVLGGVQSFLGFEVSLRCARSLFIFNPTDYSILEEKGFPHLVDSTVIPLKGEESEGEAVYPDDYSFKEKLPEKSSRKRKKVSLEENEKNLEGEQSPVEVPIELTIEKHAVKRTAE